MARHSQYPQQKVDEALLAYYTLGTYDKAGEASGVPPDTIRYWINTTKTDRYDELAAKHGPTLERQVVAKLAKTADRAASVIDQGLDATSAAITWAAEPMPQRDAYEDPAAYNDALAGWDARTSNAAKDANALSSAAKNAALVLGIATDKKLTLEGRPTHITEHRDLDDILKSLNTLVPGLVIEGTAEEDKAPALNPGSRALPAQPRPNAREPQPA